MSFGQFAATSQFYLFGRQHCTRTGWLQASARYAKPDILDTVNLAGKVGHRENASFWWPLFKPTPINGF